jgi:hypothetical protein
VLGLSKKGTAETKEGKVRTTLIADKSEKFKNPYTVHPRRTEEDGNGRPHQEPGIGQTK